MYQPFQPPVPPPPPPRDPLAVAFGNASLLGIGYFLLGRRGLGVLTTLGTLVLALVQAWWVRSGWLEIAFLVWWVLL
ncbi:hypothetical protein, partial [Crossiella equi]